MGGMNEMKSAYDAIIIGAGVIGCSIARSLSRAGLKTLNVDALPAAGYGSTSYSSAIIRPFYSYAQGVALAQASHGRWRRWSAFLEATAGEPLARYEECGMLILLPPDETELPGKLRLLDEFGVRYARMTAGEIDRRWPDLSGASHSPPRRPDDPRFGEENARPLGGGLFIRDAGYVNDPQLAAQNFCQAARRAGGRFEFNARVAEILQTEGRVCGIRLENGRRLAAPVIVNAAGPHSAKINELAGLGDRVSTRAMRHEVAFLEGPPTFAGDGTVVGDADGGVYFRPDAGSDILIGGLDPECDPPDWVDPDDYNDQLTEQWTALAWRAGLRMPALEIPNRARGAAGLYDCTPDWIPIYDRSDVPGFYLAIGTSGNQFKNAPVIGDLMRALITACEAGHDHDAAPLAYYLEDLGRAIDLGVFSRNRKGGATSGTVLA